LVGVATACVLPAGGFDYYTPFGAEAVALFRHHQVGSLQSASVLESMQGRGIGQELARRRIEWLLARNCTAVLGIAWASGRPNTSDRVFAKLGLQPLSHVKNFYHDESLQRPFTCPVCGPPSCRCSATLFVKRFA
jgi:GNAT superfamily N-acetyltransferase